ncbi:MGS1 [Sanghuangporus sanghuang]
MTSKVTWYISFTSEPIQTLICVQASPICSRQVPEQSINQHIDNGCSDVRSSASGSTNADRSAASGIRSSNKTSQKNIALASIFAKPTVPPSAPSSSPSEPFPTPTRPSTSKRSAELAAHGHNAFASDTLVPPPSKRARTMTSNLEDAQPLPERLRPQSLDDFVGQPHIIGPGSLLRHIIESGGNFGSLIFWGPPGCGKTTLARLLARSSNAVFKELSATGVGVNEVRQIFEEAKGLLSLTGKQTILFLDEIHRFNRAQQDIFLPYVEQGHIQLIGATTENPSFRVIGALLSRCRVFVLERLTDDDIREIITRAIARISPSAERDSDYTLLKSEDQTLLTSQAADVSSSEPGSSQTSSATLLASSPNASPFPEYPQITSQIFSALVSLSSGDARIALSLLSLALAAPPTTPPSQLLESLRKSVIGAYDRTGESHYDLISALHKSVRGSAGSAALYWLARMLRGGEDPLFIARRMLVCASEDIGLADPKALPLAMATYQACQVIGMPECRIHLAHLVSYLSEAPKSTRSYRAYARAEEAAARDMTLPVPLQIRNAPTKLMKDLGYGEGYRYNPDYIHPVYNQYLPAELKDEVFLKECDESDQIWDDEALKTWEREVNGRKPWEGRPDRYQTEEDRDGKTTS